MKYSEKGFENAVKGQLKGFFKAHVLKIATQFQGGILDLYVKIANMDSMWIELKYFQVPKTLVGDMGYLIPIKLSEQQRSFIKKEQSAGGKAGWVILVQLGETDETFVYASNDPELREISLEAAVSHGIARTGYRRNEDDWLFLFEFINMRNRYDKSNLI